MVKYIISFLFGNCKLNYYLKAANAVLKGEKKKPRSNEWLNGIPVIDILNKSQY
jgi:hypothetical protein